MGLVNRVSIKSKLIITLLAVSICAMSASTFICSKTGEAILTDKVFNQLTSLRVTKSSQIQNYFDGLIQHTQTLSEDLMFVAAMKDFKAAYPELAATNLPAEFDKKLDEYYSKEILPRVARTIEGTPLLESYTPKTPIARYLQYHYTASNPNPIGKKFLLDDPGDGSKYSRVHARYHPLFRNIAERFGYFDMYLIDTTGNIVYMLSKDIDFGTNLVQGLYSQSNLGSALADCLKAKSTEYVKIVDFEPYQASYGAPSSFVASPIFEGTQIIGVLAFQLPIDKVNFIMTGDKNWKENGLGDTGETYLVGRDYLMRSVSRFMLEDPEGYAKTMRSLGTDEKTINKIKEFGTTILLQEVQTTAVKEASVGKKNTKVINDYRNVPVLSSSAPLNIDGLKWIIVGQIDVAEAYAPIRSFQARVVMAATFIVVLITLVAMWLTKIFVRPINNLMSSARRVGAGEVDAVVKSGSRDEFGELAKSFNEMIGSLRSQTQLIEEKYREDEELVLNMFTPAVAKRLKRGEREIVERVSNVTILFTDLHGFTKLYQSMPPQEVVSLLNELVTGFDEMAEKYGVEKIKTIGDGYMATCGLLVPRLDHEKRTVDFGLEMLAFVRRFNYEKGLQLDLRIGISSGEVVAGIIGKNKLLYDVWGDTVNSASRIKSACPPGAILVSENLCDRLRDIYEFERVGDGAANGKEKPAAWQLKSTQQPVTAKGWESNE